MTDLARRPAPEALAPYYRAYVERVPDGSVLDTLRRQIGETAALLRGFGPDRGDHAYAPGKWTVKEVAAHLIDTERIFGVRALRLGRGDATPLPGYDQDAYVAAFDLSGRTVDELAGEFERLRASTLDVFRSLPAPTLDHVGTVNGGPMSARAVAWVLAGHERHHAEVLSQRYSDA